MEYKFVTRHENYEKYASWRVLYSAPWSAPFPVRLIDEIFQRACELAWKTTNLKLYDPCLWSGYMMTIIWFLHGSKIQSITWSDSDEKVLKIAEKNLDLLTVAWLQKRIAELESYEKLYGKQSHTDAIKDAQALLSWIHATNHHINTSCKIQSIESVEINNQCDIIIADLPYGNLTSWNWEIDIQNAIERLWNNLSQGGIMVLMSDKKQRFQDFSRQASKKAFNHGKRRIMFVKKM